jgi:hypothetical protein
VHESTGKEKWEGKVPERVVEYWQGLWEMDEMSLFTGRCIYTTKFRKRKKMVE